MFWKTDWTSNRPSYWFGGSSPVFSTQNIVLSRVVTQSKHRDITCIHENNSPSLNDMLHCIPGSKCMCIYHLRLQACACYKHYLCTKPIIYHWLFVFTCHKHGFHFFWSIFMYKGNISHSLLLAFDGVEVSLAMKTLNL